MPEHKDKKPRKKEDISAEIKGRAAFSSAFPAVVEEMIGNAGTRGGVLQVRCKIIDGPDRGKILRRNVKGPIREKDILMLRETEIEARKLLQGRKGGKKNVG